MRKLVRQSLATIPTAISYVQQREKFDATAQSSAKLAARMVAFVARGSEPTAGEAERSGEGGARGFSPGYDPRLR
jgi:hypothetical protein